MAEQARLLDEMFHCEKCPYRISNKKHFDDHMRSEHQIYQCDQCSFKANRHWNLKEHIRSIHINVHMKQHEGNT